jgi:eukaryotic-like serine/threonine-protein kinase
MPPCPAPELLTGLLSTTLTAEDEASVRAHLSHCADCRRALDQATDDPDLARWAQRANTPSSYQSEPKLLQLIERLAQSPVVFDSPAGARTMAMEFGPPRAPGDVGTLGAYRILREVGRGGLGVVFEGYDETLGRPVAIKVLRADCVDGDDFRQLAREARHAARFRHDHVVVVYAVEESSNGLPFIVMEYIPGPSVAELLRERTRLEPRQAAELAAQAALGLAAAHEAGLIHRDIKPANILFDPVTQRARIVDFGLAHVAGVPGSIAEGTLVGTPSYMSPEQACGADGVDARTDQYSLGASLYEMLSGEPPFRGTPAMVMHQVLEEEPRPPRQLSEAIPRDLETICLKTLAKDPKHRYPSAAELAADLERWLDGEPIVARPIGPAGRLLRWARRNRRVAALSATSFLLLATLAVGASVAAARIDHSRRLALVERGRADHNAERAREAAQLAADRAKVAVEQRTLALDTISTLINEMQEQLGHSAGTIALRQRLADTAMARLEKIANDPSGGPDVTLARVLAQERMGELAFLAGRTDAARKHHEAARDEAAALASSSGEQAVEANRLRALALDKLGDLALYSDKLDEARSCFHQALDLRESMPESYRSSPEGLRSRAISQNKLGDLALRLGQLDEAQAAFERGLALAEADADPDAQRHRFDLRFSYSRIGDVAVGRFDLDAADRAYRKALSYAEAQIAADPGDVRARREVPVCYSKLAGVALRRADPRGALAYYQKYVVGCEGLVAGNPNSAEARRDLMVARSLVGDALYSIPDYAGADQAYRKALELAEALSREDSRSIQKRTDVYVLIMKLAEVDLRRERFEEAAAWIEQACKSVRDSAAAGLITTRMRESLDAGHSVTGAVFLLGRQAIDRPASINQQPKEIAVRLWAVRALALPRRGDLGQAIEAAEKVRKLGPLDADSLVVVARTYALCQHAAARDGERRATPAETNHTVYAEQAIEALRAAERAQPGCLKDAWLEPELNLLYSNAEYRKILTESAAAKPGG